MSIDAPTGYLTRPEAARKFNRSQRALERDLTVALAIKDDETLVHWKLFTKDGVVRNGESVTAEIVKELIDSGMAPAWCIAETFLEETYGRKGEPRPARTFPEPASRAPGESSTREPARTVEQFDDASYLKQIIRTLEQEKDQERTRYDRIIAKLFEQLDVKDRQISAWDEVTQGLTKALATGQLTPNIGYLSSGAETDERRASTRGDFASPVHQEAMPATVDAQPSAPEATPQKASRTSEKTFTRKKPKPMKVPSKSNDKQAKQTRPSQKSRWNEFPTLKRLFSRRP